MDFKDLIKQLADRVISLKDQIQTEEATKNAFILPFIQSLGYDVFNPTEVVPEFTADIGIKKGEKVDYAIMKEGKPQILIECKWWGENLYAYSSQLFRYFHTTNAKFGLLTNGINYRFYTDLIELNKMDDKPFLEFDITTIKEQTINEVKKFHKSYFNVGDIVSSASELKYSNEIKSLMIRELDNPSVDFAKFFIRQVYTGQATEKVVTKFKEIVKKSLNQLISDIISERLTAALKKEEPKPNIPEPEPPKEPESKIITTEDELEAFYIVKAILMPDFKSDRIYYRDFQSFFSILLDDTIRQTICRFYFIEDKKSIGIVDESKKEQIFKLEKLDDIFLYSVQLTQAANRFSVKG
jgi:hypothetical protein